MIKDPESEMHVLFEGIISQLVELLDFCKTQDIHGNSLQVTDCVISHLWQLKEKAVSAGGMSSALTRLTQAGHRL